MRRYGALLGALLAITAVLAGCVTTESASGSRSFTIAIGTDLDTVDPVQMTTVAVMNIVNYGAEGLVKLDQDGTVQPSLATSWQTDPSGKMLTFHLRDGVTFHDGTEFDAQAVKFNLERLLDTKVKSPLRTPYTVIKSVEAADARTVRIYLTQPSPALLNELATTPASILSPASVEKDGNTYTNVVNPVGTGPYVFQSFDKGQKVEYERYDDYWGKKPYYSDVEFDIVPEANTREAMLRAGQADMVLSPPVSGLKELQQDPAIDVLNVASDRSIFIAMNNKRPPFDNALVRRAFNYAVNKKAIVKYVLGGTGQVMDSPFPSSLRGYCSVGTYPYDPDKARKLLEQSGVGKLSVVLGTPSGHYVQDKEASEAIAADLRDVGVDVTVKTADWPSYLANITAPLNKQTYDLHMLGGAAPALDEETQFNLLRRVNWPPASTATSFYTNSKVEESITKGLTEPSDSERNTAFCQAQKTIWNDAPWIFLWSQNLILASSSDVTGISSIPNEQFNTIYAHPSE